jgi:hypothetical protein
MRRERCKAGALNLVSFAQAGRLCSLNPINLSSALISRTDSAVNTTRPLREGKALTCGFTLNFARTPRGFRRTDTLLESPPQ